MVLIMTTDICSIDSIVADATRIVSGDLGYHPYRGILPVPWVITHGYSETSLGDGDFFILSVGYHPFRGFLPTATMRRR